MIVGLIFLTISQIGLIFMIFRLQERIASLEKKPRRVVVEVHNLTDQVIHAVTLTLKPKEPWEGEN